MSNPPYHRHKKGEPNSSRIRHTVDCNAISRMRQEREVPTKNEFQNTHTLPKGFQPQLNVTLYSSASIFTTSQNQTHLQPLSEPK